MKLDQKAWDKACQDNKTTNPTPEQVREAFQELLEQIKDEANNYYNQDGGN